MDEPLSLETARASDAEAIAAIHVAARADALPYLAPLHTDEQVRDWVASVVLARCRVWVARADDRVLGFVALDGDEVEQLYVLPGSQGRGIGSRLLDLAKRESSGRLRLHTFQRNLRARAFYEARGFRAVSFDDGSGNEEREPDMQYEWAATVP